MKGRWHIIVDYKQKWLPMKHHETRQDAFGKRGKSIFGAAVFRWSEATQELEVLNVRIACDDAHQNYYHTVQMIATTLDIVAGWRRCGPTAPPTSRPRCRLTALGTSAARPP